MLTEAQIHRFSRHILLDDVGGRGQERLLAATVRIPSLDEAGRSEALWLARSGVGTLELPRDPSPAPGRDPAGLLYAADAGRPLCDAVAERLLEHHPDLRIGFFSGEIAPGAGGAEGALTHLREVLAG